MQMLAMAAYRSEKYEKEVKFLFPSSIAAYGFRDLAEKTAAGRVKEDEYNAPQTMYGCNKLYCEKLGVYYSKFLGQRHLEPNPPTMLDFRAIRFPGLVSAFTMPSGGTSDYGPEMLHAAAQSRPYACFVREDTKISFMAMPDAVKSLLMLMDAPREQLSCPVYNIAAFSLTAGEFRDWAVRSPSRAHRSPSSQTSAARASSIRGRKIWMIRRPARNGVGNLITMWTGSSTSISCRRSGSGISKYSSQSGGRLHRCCSRSVSLHHSLPFECFAIAPLTSSRYPSGARQPL